MSVNVRASTRLKNVQIAVSSGLPVTQQDRTILRGIASGIRRSNAALRIAFASW